MKENNITKPFYNTEIPGDWEVKKVKDIGKITSGTTPLRSNLEYHKNGTIPWVKTTDLNNSFIIETEEKVTELALKETSLRLFPKNTVLVAMYGGFNQIGRTGILNAEASINQALSAITISKNETDPLFLLNWLNAKVGIWKKFAGSSRKDPNITSKDVGDFPFIKIPLPEQKAIARLLSTWDRAISQNNQIIAQKELRKKWLMQNLLTGKKRLPAFVNTSAGIKGFDEEWQEVKLGNFIKESRIPSKKNNVDNRITVKLNLNGIEKREVRGTEVKDATSYFVRKAGQFVYGKQNLHKGAFGIIPDDLDGYESSQDIPTFDFIGDINPIFFFLFLSQENVYKSLERISTGTGSKRIHPESLYKVKFQFPYFKEQTAIARVLQAADKEIQLLKTKTEKLREQKKWLMQVLLTGKKRLRI